MKIKRFFAEDMRTALLKVRQAMGPDAVILSNQKMDGGVEIVAAMDYDASLFEDQQPVKPAEPKMVLPTLDKEPVVVNDKERMRKEVLDDLRFARNLPKFIPEPTPKAVPAKADANKWVPQPEFVEMQTELKSLRGLLINQLSGLSWGNEVRYHPLRARLLQRLIALGLSPSLARDISGQVKESEDFEHNWRHALGELAHRIPSANDTILEKGGVVAVVGATGVGKTTSIAKLAARYTLKHGPHRVALITTDNYRVAAHEQLRSYARIMGVPMRIAGDMEQLKEAIESFGDKELILIDTAGMSQRDMELSKKLALLKLKGMKQKVQVFLAMASNCQRAVLEEVAQAFAGVQLAGCLLTKLDETTSLGGALSVAIEKHLPVAYVSDGQQVPEDLHLARAHNLVSRAVSIMHDVAASHNRDESLAFTIGGMVMSAHG